jgi:hypothetical protein
LVFVKSHLVILALLLAVACSAAELNQFRIGAAKDVNGHELQLATNGTRVIALVFLGPECPVSQRYAPELNRIARAQTNGVEFLGVISAPSITRTQALTFTKDYALEFPVIFDERGELARWLKPTHMPEAFVLKLAGEVVYHGRIDDAFAAPGKPRMIFTHHELRDAISAVLAGRKPAKSFAQPVGCYFEDWPKK